MEHAITLRLDRCVSYSFLWSGGLWWVGSTILLTGVTPFKRDGAQGGQRRLETFKTSLTNDAWTAEAEVSTERRRVIGQSPDILAFINLRNVNITAFYRDLFLRLGSNFYISEIIWKSFSAASQTMLYHIFITTVWWRIFYKRPVQKRGTLYAWKSQLFLF